MVMGREKERVRVQKRVRENERKIEKAALGMYKKEEKKRTSYL